MNTAVSIILSLWVGGFVGFLICSLLTVGREESEWWDAAHEVARKENEDREIK